MGHVDAELLTLKMFIYNSNNNRVGWFALVER